MTVDLLFEFLVLNGGYSNLLTLEHGALALLCLLGIGMHSLLVYVFIFSRELHDRCNFLIVAYSIGIIPYLAGICVKFFVLLLRINFIPLSLCFSIQLLPHIGAKLAMSAQLCVALDRLIAILFPIWYMTSDKYKTFCLFILIALIRTFLINYLQYFGANLHPDKQVMCMVGDVVQSEVYSIIYDELLALYSADFLCYALIWGVMFCKRKTQNAQNARRLMKSLTVIMGISFFCFIVSTLFRLLITPLIPVIPAVEGQPPTQTQIDMAILNEALFNVPINFLYTIGYCSPPVVLFLLSRDYANALHRHFFVRSFASVITQNEANQSTWAQRVQQHQNRHNE